MSYLAHKIFLSKLENKNKNSPQKIQNFSQELLQIISVFALKKSSTMVIC